MVRLRTKKSQTGFTIIELLIATLIFSMVMLLCTMGIIQIGKAYYANINRSNTQDTARNIIDEIARSIEFSGGEAILPSTTVNTGNGIDALCVNQRLYSFLTNHQLSSASFDATHASHVLVATELTSGTCSSSTPPLDFINNPLPAEARELVGPRMRLAKLDIPPPSIGSDLYTITVRVVYGDNDLLCSPAAGDCSQTSQSTNLGNSDLTCKLRAGAELCAVSELTTTVKKRVK